MYISTSALLILITNLVVTLMPGGTRSQSNITDDDTPIYCYQCNSGVDKDCINLQANNTNSVHFLPCVNYEEYGGHKPFCRKIVQNIFERNMVRVVRKCGWVVHPRLDCYEMTNDDHEETVCQCFHDGCNSALTYRSSLTVGTTLLLGLGHFYLS